MKTGVAKVWASRAVYLGCFAVLGVGVLHANPSPNFITYEFTGTITEVGRLPGEGWWYGSPQVGDSFSGSFQYDPSWDVSKYDAFGRYPPFALGVDWKWGLYGGTSWAFFSWSWIDPGYLEFSLEPVGAELITLRFEPLPGQVVSSLPTDLRLSDWARVTVTAEQDAGPANVDGLDNYFVGTVTSWTRQVPETGSTALLLLIALAAVGFLLPQNRLIAR